MLINLPKEDTGPANTSNCSTHYKSIHGRCCGAKRRTGFEKDNTRDEEKFEVKIRIQGSTFKRQISFIVTSHQVGM